MRESDRNGIEKGDIVVHVLLAMSGGVDSSVAAHLLLEQGHRVTGVFMEHLPPQPASPSQPLPPGCGNAADARDAQEVAHQLGIPLEICRVQDSFQELIDHFVEEYLRGRTPNPCIECNRRFKFGKLFQKADRVEADFLATGHYVQRLSHPRWLKEAPPSLQKHLPGVDSWDDPAICRGVDFRKDQSYVLMRLERKHLARLLFPNGEKQKEEIRKIAMDKGLHVARKKDSQDICFISQGGHAELVRRRRPETDTSGEITTTTGEVVGQHDGLERYTIGQRKGLGIAFGERKFVVRLEPESRRVVVGDREALAVRRVFVSKMNWLIPLPQNEFRCKVQFRYRTPSAWATVVPCSEAELVVHFEEPNYGIAPGQGLACYLGDRLLGGGWIDRAE